MKLSEAKIGSIVAYQPYPAYKPELGMVMNIRKPYVFVRFGSDSNSKAVNPAFLSYPKRGELHRCLNTLMPKGRRLR